MTVRFASIGNAGTHAYAYESDAWTSNAPIHTSFRMYQTYGDGMCQHSGDWAVTTEYAADYLLSLAQAMLADEDLAQRLVYTLAARPSEKDIAFCASVVFKPIDEAHSWEKKTRYFSIAEKKITTAEAKQYDKRYQRVERNHDGRADAIYNMLIPEYASGLERLLYTTAIREYLMGLEHEHGWMDLPMCYLKWTEDRDKARDLMHSLESAQQVAKAYQLRSCVQSSIEGTKRNMERAKAQAESVAAAESAA